MTKFAGNRKNNLDLYKIIGKNLRQLRLEIPVTQAGLAKYLCVHNDTISKLELGKIRAEYSFIKDIAELFQITTDELAIENNYKNLCGADRYHVYDRLNVFFECRKRTRSYQMAVKRKKKEQKINRQ